MRIYITGCTGSGKTTLARQLSTRYQIPVLFLDDIFWKRPYEEAYSEPVKKRKLSAFLHENQMWVIEGVYTSFTGSAFREADIILFLDPPLHVLMHRIISRYLKARISGKREPFPKQLLKDIFAYKRGGLLQRKQQQMIQDFSDKTVRINKSERIDSIWKIVESYKNKS